MSLRILVGPNWYGYPVFSGDLRIRTAALGAARIGAPYAGDVCQFRDRRLSISNPVSERPQDPFFPLSPAKCRRMVSSQQDTQGGTSRHPGHPGYPGHSEHSGQDKQARQETLGHPGQDTQARQNKQDIQDT
jgi:hypothetical protein